MGLRCRNSEVSCGGLGLGFFLPEIKCMAWLIWCWFPFEPNNKLSLNGYIVKFPIQSSLSKAELTTAQPYFTSKVVQLQ